VKYLRTFLPHQTTSASKRQVSQKLNTGRDWFTERSSH